MCSEAMLQVRRAGDEEGEASTTGSAADSAADACREARLRCRCSLYSSLAEAKVASVMLFCVRQAWGGGGSAQG